MTTRASEMRNQTGAIGTSFSQFLFTVTAQWRIYILMVGQHTNDIEKIAVPNSYDNTVRVDIRVEST